MNNATMGQRAYERDVECRPTYHDGSPRPAWHALPEIARWSWERPPADCTALECPSCGADIPAREAQLPCWDCGAHPD